MNRGSIIIDSNLMDIVFQGRTQSLLCPQFDICVFFEWVQLKRCSLVRS